MKINLLFRPPENRTEDYRLKLWSYYSREGESLVIDLYVFRLIPYLLVAALAGYFLCALALFIWISRKPQEDVGYWDVVAMPFDWEGFQEKRGRLYIQAGQQDITNQRYQEGVMKIRLGLQKYPEDREARLFLAQVYYAAGLINRAHDLMLKGIDAGMRDIDFLTAFFNLCYESEAYSSVLEVTDELLNDSALASDPGKSFFIHRHRVTALLELGRIDEAYEMAHAINSDPDGIRRMVDAEYLALIKKGKPIEALTLLERWRFRLGTQSVQLQNLLIDTYIELGDDRHLQQAITDLINFDRLDPHLRILALRKWHKAGKMKEFDDAFTSYMLLFAWDPGNLRKINNLVTRIRAIPYVEQVLSYTRKRGMNEEVILFNLFYAYLMDGRWDEAGGVLDLLKGALDSFMPTDQRLIGIGETIIRLKTEKRDNLRLLLLEELRRLRASIAFYVTVASILQQSQLYDVAVDTLEQGLAVFPQSPQINEAYRAATRLALEYMRENQDDQPVEVLERGPDQYLDQLDAFLHSGRFDAADDLLTRIYRIGAPWLEGRREDFEYRKLQLYFETRDRHLQSQTTTLFLNDNPGKGPQLMQLARSYIDQGETGKSRILAEEIVRNNPRNQEARKLLEQLGGPNPEPGTGQEPPTGPGRTAVPSKVKILTDLETALQAGDWEGTEQLIQQTLRASPPWLSGDREEFDLLHIRYYLECGNFPSASSLIRIYMGSDATSARALLDLARKYRDQEREREMNFLVEQVNRKFPNLKL